MLSSAQCPSCGKPTLVTQNVKADVIQCFCGPHKSSSQSPKPKVSGAFKKASFGWENCPGWESNRDEVGISSCSSSKQQHCFVLPGAAHVQESMSSVPQSQDQSCPTHHLNLLPSGWGRPGPLEQQKSKGIYPGWGWHMPWERTESRGADNSVLPLTCFIFPSDHSIYMLPLFQDESCSFYLHFWTSSSFSCCGAQLMLSAFPPFPFPSPSQNSPDGFIYFSFRSYLWQTSLPRRSSRLPGIGGEPDALTTACPCKPWACMSSHWSCLKF